MPTFCDDIHPSVLPLLVHTDLAQCHLTCPLIIHTGLPSSVRPIRTCRERNRQRSPYNAVFTSSLESAHRRPLPQQVRETIAEDTDGQQAIRKPPGEAGQPGRGGYTLEKAEYVKLVSKDELNLTKAYTHQKMGNILKVVDKVHRKKFPTVNKFDEAWPIHDLVRVHLMTCSYAARLSAKHN
ncbi:hypothetical protein L208DRAFT_1302448 [Tricholoma matsutake]|nr:hypothetical protein L208DRAFT_1302448 [Tricholoma matsutake 945]